jgi:hypothetical protein
MRAFDRVYARGVKTCRSQEQKAFWLPSDVRYVLYVAGGDDRVYARVFTQTAREYC